jgi:hypothetical protein
VLFRSGILFGVAFVLSPIYIHKFQEQLVVGRLLAFTTACFFALSVIGREGFRSSKFSFFGGFTIAAFVTFLYTSLRS